MSAARRLVPFARLALALALLLPAFSPRFASPASAAITNVYFPQTGHALGYHFKVSWEQRGGLISFGYPLSEEFEEHGRATQYFERAVLQHFPEYAGTSYEVQPVQLGRELLRGREREAPLRPVEPIDATANRIYFAQTGHILQYGFLQAWKAGGGLPVYGYPLTEEFIEVSPSDGRPYTVQYFERNRFEWHPENKGTPYEFQLGLLGAQRAAALNLLGAPPFRPIPAPPAVARVVSRGDATQPLVALTFDAGADRGNAARILDTLAANDIRSSFGITGQWARANPDLVRRMAAEGHHVFNHTDDHRSFTGVSDRLGGLSPEERVAQLDRADAAIAALVGRSTRPWFRSPYGDHDAATQEQLAAAGYYYNVLWTIDSLGWNGLSAGAVAGRVLAGAAPGAIVLFHVGASSADAAALQAIIDGLRARGYDFATVDELVQP